MKLTQLMGLFLIASPFILCFIYGVKTIGLKAIAIVFSLTVALVAIISSGAYLLIGQGEKMIPITEELSQKFIDDNIDIGYFGPYGAVIGDKEFILYYDDNQNSFLAHRSEFEFIGVTVSLKKEKK